MTSFAEINIDILNIDAMVKRLGMSGKAYWIQHNFSETMRPWVRHIPTLDLRFLIYIVS